MRVSREEMVALKEAGELPCGQLPVLEVDGQKMSQSQAMATWAGKLTGLYPTDAWAAAKCDEVTQFINQDIRERCISPTMREKDEEKKTALRKELAEVKLPEKFAMLETLLSPSGYFVGDSITLADLHCYVMLNWLGMEVLDGVPKEVVLANAKLTNLCKMVNEHVKVAAWNAEKNAGKVPWFAPSAEEGHPPAEAAEAAEGELKLSWPEVVGMKGLDATKVIGSAVYRGEKYVKQASTCGPYDDEVREMMASMQASMPDPPGIVKVVITAAGKVVQGRAQVQVEVDAEGKVARIPTIVEVEVD